MSKKFGLFIFIISLQTVHGATLNAYAVEYSKAIELMEKNQFHEAILIMEPLAKTNKNYHLFLSLGDAHAAIEQPAKALPYYKMVYDNATASNNALFKRVALFKIARMQLWMNNSQAAINAYHQLLSMKLSAKDEVIANMGLQRASHLEHQDAVQEKHLQFEKAMQQAENALHLNNGQQAYALIKNYLHQKEDVRLYLIAADSMVSTNQPQKALLYYQHALQLSHATSEKINILFSIARMQFWLGHYVSADKTYQLLLKYNLNPQEHELALAGRVKSLAYYDRPRTAYHIIPTNLVFTTPELVIAASQAASWANWADISKSTLTTYQPITNNINLQSSLGKDLQDLQWQTKLATSPGVLTPSFFSSHDSENFDKNRVLVDYSRYWSQLSQTSVGLDYISYTQNNPNKLNARGVYLGQIVRPTRDLIFRGQIEPIEYKNLTPFEQKNWSPFLWAANASYTPNDYVSLRLITLKEVVETFPAFANQITDNQYAAAVTVNPLPYVQLNGSYAKLHFSDTNDRNSGFLSSTVAILPSYGISATGILRRYTDKFTSPNYFSPHEYWADAFSLKLSRKLGTTWHYYLDGGVGRQFIVSQPDSSTAESPTYQWGLGVTGPINKWLILNAFYADVRQASAFLDSPGYHYQYGGVSLNFMM